MRAGDDGLAIIDIGLVQGQKVSPGVFEPGEVQRPLAIEHADVVHQLLQRTFELPPLVGREVVVRGDKHGNAVGLGGLEEFFDVLYRVVVGHALADHAPRDPFGTQEVVLGIGDDQRGIPGGDCHTRLRQARGDERRHPQ